MYTSPLFNAKNPALALALVLMRAHPFASPVSKVVIDESAVSAPHG